MLLEKPVPQVNLVDAYSLVLDTVRPFGTAKYGKDVFLFPADSRSEGFAQTLLFPQSISVLINCTAFDCQDTRLCLIGAKLRPLISFEAGTDHIGDSSVSERCDRNK